MPVDLARTKSRKSMSRGEEGGKKDAPAKKARRGTIPTNGSCERDHNKQFFPRCFRSRSYKILQLSPMGEFRPRTCTSTTRTLTPITQFSSKAGHWRARLSVVGGHSRETDTNWRARRKLVARRGMNYLTARHVV